MLVCAKMVSKRLKPFPFLLQKSARCDEPLRRAVRVPVGVPVGVPLRRDLLYSTLSYWGTSGRGVRSYDPSERSSVPGGGRSSEAEEVPDCSRLNWWVISNHQPPVKLRAGPQGTGESSKEWGDSEALPTPPGLCA